MYGRFPALLVGMLKASKLTGMPVVQTDLQAKKLNEIITWDLATSAPKKSKIQTAKKKPSNFNSYSLSFKVSNGKGLHEG